MPKGVCCLFTPRVIQGSFITIGLNFVNLAGLLRVLISQIKTSSSGGLNFDRCFEGDCDSYINESMDCATIFI